MVYFYNFGMFRYCEQVVGLAVRMLKLAKLVLAVNTTSDGFRTALECQEGVYL